jgi:hypothetical protein
MENGKHATFREDTESSMRSDMSAGNGGVESLFMYSVTISRNPEALLYHAVDACLR